MHRRPPLSAGEAGGCPAQGGIAAEKLEQQTATADVLEVISRSAFDLNTVLNSVVTTAARLCQAGMSFTVLKDGEVFRLTAKYGFSLEFEAWATNHPLPSTRGSLTRRASIERRRIHISDVFEDPEYTTSEYRSRGGDRSILGVPLPSKGQPIGVFFLARPVVHPSNSGKSNLSPLSPIRL